MNLYFAHKFATYLVFSWHRNGHGIHSPFVYELVTRAFKRTIPPHAHDILSRIRDSYRNDNALVDTVDLGAGSASSNKSVKSVAHIHNASSLSRRYARLLYNVACDARPRVIIELGTCLGVGTATMALACPQASVITIEGNPFLASRALQTLQQCNITNCELITGEFSAVLPGLLHRLDTVDMVFFDGNHREESTWMYFTLCLEKAHERSVFVFDDIAWSPAMARVWDRIKHHPRVVFTVDLCRMGLVFFNPVAPSQHFVIRY